MTEKDFFDLIARELSIKPEQVEATVALLDDDNTVPFITRYRKEVTGGLDEVQINSIHDRIRYLRMLEERKETVLASIEEQGKLTDELRDKIRAAVKLQEVEDLYLPYKPKKRTRATIAKEKGLEPFAERIWGQEDESGQPEEIAAEFVDEEKGVSTAEEAIAGARDIIAEWISDDAEVRKLVRQSTWDKGFLVSEAKDPDNVDVYEIYKDYRDPLKKVLPYRTLAINRGDKEGFLKVTIDAPVDEIIADLEKKFVTNPKCIFLDHVKAAIRDSYDRLISTAIEREMRNRLSEAADDHAITVFAENLRNLLMQPPMKGQKIMGIDPGYRTGCKVAVIDQTGRYLDGDTIYPHEPKKRWDYSKEQLASLATKHGVTLIAIGNGTASRETEQLVAELIQEKFTGEQVETGQEVHYTIVNEAGASVYSASELARKELPDLDAAQRGNVSIARRLLDPLSELVKIDPKSIGVGLYQHDVNQSRLAESLDRVVESCVNNVGVNLNTASPALLRYVAGITRSTASNIVNFRDQAGGFKTRAQLIEVKGLGPKAFTQCAGFLRIPNADLFFDSTAVHPESYEAAEKMLALVDLQPELLKNNGHHIKQRLKELDKDHETVARECNIGLPTLEDIIAAIEKPDRDPRDDVPKPFFRQDVLRMEDLHEGMILKGTVRNVVDFGAFVDIGVKQDGLVHLSEMSYNYIKSPLEVLAVGDIVDVRVIRIEQEKGRIGLSMLLDGERRSAERKSSRKRDSEGRPSKRSRRGGRRTSTSQQSKGDKNQRGKPSKAKREENIASSLQKLAAKYNTKR